MTPTLRMISAARARGWAQHVAARQAFCDTTKLFDPEAPQFQTLSTRAEVALAKKRAGGARCYKSPVTPEGITFHVEPLGRFKFQ